MLVPDFEMADYTLHNRRFRLSKDKFLGSGAFRIPVVAWGFGGRSTGILNALDPKNSSSLRLEGKVGLLAVYRRFFSFFSQQET
jgi:hypothetical protein